ncbi:autotransporter assembly complex family protein [uncultured Salinisphaera sp.]|uniref:autotransporter assembly complex protein TamA n=1 Tax=uncultured Salinisphaera sp. TaxID=359372 RepID=UPI0032B1E8F7
MRAGVRFVTGLGCAGVLCAAIGWAPAVWADTVEVEIVGIDNPLRSNARKSLSVAAKHEESWSAGHIQTLYRLAPKEIKQALMPYGYYAPEIETELDKPAAGSETWQARFTVKKGPATKIRTLNIAARGPGDQLDALRRAMKDTELATDQRLVQSRYTATKSAMFNAAYNAGYLDAAFSQSAIRVDPEARLAEIDLVLDTGERYYFGPVTFKQDLLADDFVQRFVPFDSGEPYSAQELIDLQLVLNDSDYYSQIEIDAERARAQRELNNDAWFYDLIYPPSDPLESIGQLRIPVTVTAEPSKGQSYKFSAGYGTDTGPRVGAGVKFRHLNRQGHQFRLDTRVSQIQRSLQAAYDIPIENVAQDKLSFTASINNEQFGDITSTYYGVGVVRDTGWQLGRKRAYLRFQQEFYDLGNGNQNSILLYPGYNVTLQKADDLLFTRKGVSASFDVHGAAEALASSTNMISAELNGAAVLPVTETTRVVSRGRLGAIGTDNFEDVPPSQRFFAGGAQSVRGYNFQSISPTNADNEDIGGRYVATFSLEGNWFFYNKFGLATFFDAGDVTNEVGDFSLKKGVGIGFRYGSPVGMVRLDVAHPLDDTGGDFAIHFSLGPDL